MTKTYEIIVTDRDGAEVARSPYQIHRGLTLPITDIQTARRIAATHRDSYADDYSVRIVTV